MAFLIAVALVALVATVATVADDNILLLVDPDVVPVVPSDWAVHINAARKEPRNPLLIEDKLWDVRWDNTYPTARYDETAKQFRMWYNSFVSMSSDKAHPGWKRQFPGLTPMHVPGDNAGMMYATSPDGVNWTKAELELVRYDWNGTAATPPAGKTNLVMLQAGNPDNGVMYDRHERNASRRYKALGSFYGNLCRGKDSKTPTTATVGTLWPPCHNLGVAFSADGIRFDHAQAETNHDPGDAPGLDTVGQNDGALDLAMWDDDLGSYWGLVRVDVAGVPDPKADGAEGYRRTGRFTTKDFKIFSAGVEVFHGRAGYEIYTIQPFRLKSYRPGYYLATAMFYNTSDPQVGHVQCELLQTTDFGLSWHRVAGEEGVEFIARGPEGAFDSHTVYTAWGGDQWALLDPADPDLTLFYYAGGNGPHSGARDDSIGLARATTNAYAGLRTTASTTATTLTVELQHLNVTCAAPPALSILASIDGPAGRVGVRGFHLIAAAVPYRAGTGWVELRDIGGQAAAPRLQRLIIEAMRATVYAIRASCP